METATITTILSNGTTGMYIQIASLSTIVFFLVEVAKKIMPDKLESEYIPMVSAGIGVVLAVLVGIKEHLDIFNCIIQGLQLGGNAILAASGKSFVGMVADKAKNGNGNGKIDDKGSSGKPDGDI